MVIRLEQQEFCHVIRAWKLQDANINRHDADLINFKYDH